MTRGRCEVCYIARTTISRIAKNFDEDFENARNDFIDKSWVEILFSDC